MSRTICLMLTVIVCGFSPRCARAQSADGSNTEGGNVPTIELTRLDVNETTLELSYGVKNKTDHDIWICDDVAVYSPLLDFEVYMSRDEESLLIRKRLDVPTAWEWAACPYGRYVLIRPDEERSESLSLALPIQPRRLFAGGRTNADHAKDLVLEIGFYSEDLPGLVRGILEIAEKLHCARLDYSEFMTDLFMRFFKGIWIEQAFGGLSGFEDFTYTDGDEEINIPYTWQRFSGEQVLRMQAEGVHIPYEEAPWATDEPPQNETELAGVTAAFTRLDVNDTSLELAWKITNDSDHDVWVCDEYVDRFMDKDNQTLVFRMRYNLSNKGVVWGSPAPHFKYSRLQPGRENVKSLALPLPVEPNLMFEASVGDAESAKRLAVEIGFYNEDLSALIVDVVRMAEKLNCDDSVIPPWEPNSALELYYRYFGGVEIARLFKSGDFAYFRNSVLAGGGEIVTPYLFQTLNGERTLRIEVGNLSIPYKSN